MFQTVQQIISSITDLSEGKETTDKEFTDKHKKFLTQMDYKYFDKVFQMITNQKPIKNPQYSIYKMAYDDDALECEFVSYVLSDPGDVYHTVIDASDKHLVLNTLTPACLAQYIKDNEKNETVFITFNYSCSAQDAQHQASILINTKTKKIYLVDPNGSTCYFNNIFDMGLDTLVEKMLHNYFAELKKFDYDFKYEFIGTWNKKTVALNTSFKDTFIGTGHCVVLTSILAHIISILKCNPLDAYLMLKELSEEEMLFIIKEYTSAIFNLFH